MYLKNEMTVALYADVVRHPFTGLPICVYSFNLVNDVYSETAQPDAGRASQLP